MHQMFFVPKIRIFLHHFGPCKFDSKLFFFYCFLQDYYDTFYKHNKELYGMTFLNFSELLLSIRVLLSLGTSIKESIEVISNFNHQRASRGTKLGTFRPMKPQKPPALLKMICSYTKQKTCINCFFVTYHMLSHKQ